MRARVSSFLVVSSLSSLSLAALVACGSDDDFVGVADAGGEAGTDSGVDGSIAPDASVVLDASVSDATVHGDSDAAADASDASDGGWTLETIPGMSDLYTVGGTGPGDVYVAGLEGIFHSTGNGTWTQELTSESVILDLSDDGQGHMYASDLFARVYTRSAGGMWTFGPKVPVCGNDSAHGSRLLVRGAAFYVAIGAETCVGTSTDPTATGATSTLGSTTSFSGTTQVFAVGAEPLDGGTGFAAYFDGASWQTLGAPFVQPAYGSAVAVGTSALVVSASGVYESVSHGALSLLTSAGADAGPFGGAWGDSVTEAWIAGGGTNGAPAITHFTTGNAAADGGTLAQENVPTPPDQFVSIWGTGTGELYAVGRGGTLAHKR